MSFRDRVKSVWRMGGNLWALIGEAGLQALPQLCGLNTLLYYQSCGISWVHH